MRRLISLLLLLCCLTLPALAEEAPAVPEEYVGEWKQVLSIAGDQLYTYFDSEVQNLVITADGSFTFTAEDAPQLSLLHDAEADEWYIPIPDSGAKLLLRREWFPEQLFLTADAAHMMVFIRADSPPVQLSRPYPAVSYSGTWRVDALYPWADLVSSQVSSRVELNYNYYENRMMDPVTITLPPFPGLDTIQQVWTDVVSQLDGSPLQSLQELYGYELYNEYTLLLITRHGILSLSLISHPEIDPALEDAAEGLAGWWYPDELSVGGIYLPASLLDIPDEPIAIDEQGNVLLPDGIVTALRLEENTLLLGEYPVSGSLSLTLADDVELDFMPEEDWYREQLNGDWQLSRIQVPSLGMDESIAPAITDVTLNIDSSDWCYMDSDKYYLFDTFYDMTQYRLNPLYGDDTYTLTIVSLSTLHVKPESSSYTLIFTRIEEPEE